MNKKKNTGCGFGILGTLAVVAGVILYALLSSMLNKLFSSLRFGNTDNCALLTLSLASLTFVFILLEAIFLIFFLKLNQKSSENGKKAGKILKTVIIVCIALILLTPIFTANTFTQINGSSISKVCFVEYQKYDISSDIEKCILSCNEQGTLSFTVCMTDGEKIEIFESVNTCTDTFIKKYENIYGYAAYLSRGLEHPEYRLRISGEKYMETFYKEGYPEIWKYLSEMISLPKI